MLSSGSDGQPPALVGPDGRAVDWDKFTPEEWRYNPGREAFAPNFSKYEALSRMRMNDGRTALRHVVDRYRSDMDQIRLTQGEFKTLLDRMHEKDYVPQGIQYQVGNLDANRIAAIEKAGVGDSRVMVSDIDLYHGTADKVADQKIPKERFDELYKMLQSPERIYENNQPKYPRLGREFHFVRSTGDGKVIKVVLRQKMKTSALHLTTFGWVNDSYDGGQYEKIW